VIVGLTGGIASGKSTVSRMLVERGAALVDCDVLAHAALERGQAAYHEVVAAFGRELLLPNGEIDRSRLGGIVFSDADARRRLEEIVHPAVLRMARQQIDAHQADGRPVIILDAPLLIEAGLLEWVDKVIVVFVDEKVEMERLMARNRLESDEARRRIASQMPLSAKVKLADYIIDNGGGLDATRAQVDRVWEDILNHAEAHRIDCP
jgi:dephospho-CoA kinase